MSISKINNELGVDEKVINVVVENLSLLKGKNKPAFFVITYQSTVFRDRVIERLTSDLSQKKMSSRIINLTSPELSKNFSLYNLIIEESKSSDLLIIYNWGTNRTDDFHTLNLMRDDMRIRGIRLVFLLRDDELGVFGGAAPDLWSHHQSFNIIEGKPTSEIMERTISFQIEQYPYKSSKEAIERLNYLKDYLKDTEDRLDLANHRIRILSEIVNIYLFLGNIVEALNYSNELLKIARETKNEEAIGGGLNILGQIKHQMGDLNSALKHFYNALEIGEKIYIKEHPNIAIVLNNIGLVLKDKGDLDGALDYLKRALEIDEKVYGKEHLSVASGLNNIGSVLKDKGDLDGALDYLKRALVIDEKIYGKEYPNVARDLNNLGLVLQDKGDLDGALDYLKRALVIDEKVYGQEYPNVAICLLNIGGVLKAKGDLDGALDYLKRALVIDEKVYGQEHPNVAIDLNNISMVLKAKGDLGEALDYLKRALVIDEKVYGQEHPNVAIRLNNIGLVLKDNRDLGEALDYLKRALVIYEKVYGQENPNVATVLNNIGMVLQDKGDLDGARRYIKQAFVIFNKTYGPDNPRTITALENYTDCGGKMEDLMPEKK